MPKVYEPKKENDELSLRVMQIAPGECPSVQMVDENGYPFEIGALAVFTPDGVRLVKHIVPELATRAGFSPEALDSNGRLKVIGQESVEAEKLRHTKFQCDIAGDDTLIVEGGGYGSLDFSVMRGGHGLAVNISPDNIRDLAARFNRHVAYLDKEGL